MQEKKTDNHEGKTLQILIFKSGMDKKDIAPLLGVRPDYISTLIKSDVLTPKIKRNAAKVFGVSYDVFENPKLLDNALGVGLVAREMDVAYSAKTKPDEYYLRLIEEMQKDFHSERMKMLGIIEKLSTN